MRRIFEERGRSRHTSEATLANLERRRPQWWVVLVQILNGNWTEDFGYLVHYCAFPDDPLYRIEIIRKLLEALIHTVFRKLPPVPTSNKWVQRAQCLFWIFLACAPHNLLPHLYARAFSDIHVTVEREAAAFEKRGGSDVDLQVELNFHKVCGSRMTKCNMMLTDAWLLVLFHITAIVLEPLQYYCRWLFVVGRAIQDLRVVRPIFDLVDPQRSPILAVRQYISSLMSG